MDSDDEESVCLSKGFKAARQMKNEYELISSLSRLMPSNAEEISFAKYPQKSNMVESRTAVCLRIPLNYLDS